MNAYMRFPFLFSNQIPLFYGYCRMSSKNNSPSLDNIKLSGVLSNFSHYFVNIT